MSAADIRSLLVSVVTGLLFGVGLIHSGMVNPAKVQGFLDIAGNWDPSLALVMAGAIAVALPAFQWSQFRFPDRSEDRRTYDRELIAGSLLFGVGWGLSGYCPGPALVASSAGSWEALWYVIAMAFGIVVGDQFSSKRAIEPTPIFDHESEII